MLKNVNVIFPYTDILIYLAIYVIIRLTKNYIFEVLECVYKKNINKKRLLKKWQKKKRGMNLLEKKLLLKDFVQADRFELNLYLSYLLKQVKVSEKV